VTARVVWATGGGEARVVSLAPNAITLRSTVPWPPGSRVEGTVRGVGADFVLRMKVHSSRRGVPGEFVVEGRPLDLTREARLRLEGTLSA
jgi:hypothetical protein